MATNLPDKHYKINKIHKNKRKEEKILPTRKKGKIYIMNVK